MALSDFATDDSGDTDTQEHICPNCEKKGSDTDYWYYRCHTADCKVVTYMYPKRDSAT